jgi:hypothetical protein
MKTSHLNDKELKAANERLLRDLARNTREYALTTDRSV